MRSLEEAKGKAAEQFVSNLAHRTFLQYWCFPNPKDEDGDRKEICDLLVLFSDTCLIFSVKNYRFTGEHDAYFKKTVAKAARQILGAERKLFASGRDIRVNHTQRGSYLVNRSQYRQIYRIIVNVGVGYDYHPLVEVQKQKWISVFTSSAIGTIMGELDTVADFAKYLADRETYLKKLKAITVVGTEADLCATYLRKGRTFPLSEEILGKEYDGVFLEIDGEWNEYDKNPSVKWKRQRDRNSYFVDELVERELIPRKVPESILRELLSFSRLKRRAISNAFIDFARKYMSSKKQIFARRFALHGNLCLVYAYYSPDMEDDIVAYLVQLAVESTAAYNNYKGVQYLGIAFTDEVEKLRIVFSEDIALTEAERKDIMQRAKEIGWFSKMNEIRQNETEYPE